MIFMLKRLKTKTQLFVRNSTIVKKLKPPWNVLFFGSDEFSIASLKILNNEYKDSRCISNLEVVTGAKINPVRKFALQEQLKAYDWPFKVPEQHEFHIGVVVSFGHLIPKNVIDMFPLGVLNVHASLLPKWRGAAPIIYAIANGDSQTGVTIMKIEPEKFDVGDIVAQKVIHLSDSVTLPEVHKELSNIGANCLLECIKELPQSVKNCRKQCIEGVTHAPRITSAIANIYWDKMSAKDIYNLSRALTGVYHLTTFWNNTSVKLINIKLYSHNDTDKIIPGRVIFNKKQKNLIIQCQDGNWISVDKIGVLNKKSMSAIDFNNGYIKKVMLQNRIFR